MQVLEGSSETKEESGLLLPNKCSSLQTHMYSAQFTMHRVWGNISRWISEILHYVDCPPPSSCGGFIVTIRCDFSTALTPILGGTHCTPPSTMDAPGESPTKPNTTEPPNRRRNGRTENGRNRKRRREQGGGRKVEIEEEEEEEKEEGGRGKYTRL
ncbi:hypothetical protein RHMOL_Rhmol09G0147300 [Rhododendron molle]|uniref:Uncharacterized protein n=1 Tax=Rhododendron molle TaxID=49168 RepID=A0ACC0MEL1_RHOML|nr:hypothetical protein RHMOL_Rhmol09G0147300 [Rhododendron molle]